MSKVYLHSGNNENSLNKVMLYLLIPFILFGFYKNGIKLYTGGYVNLFMMFKPLILVGISVLTTFIFSRLNKETFIGFRFMSNLMISIIALPRINILIYIILIIILNVLLKFWRFNIVPVFMVISILIAVLMKSYDFFNAFELSVEHSYSLIDYILGKGYGGISNTLLIMTLGSLIVLMLNINYKKQIPLLAFSVYYVFALITTFAMGNASQELLLNNNVIFAFVFLSNVSIYTPYSRGGCYIYGLLLGLLTFAFYFIDLNLGLYIVIMLLSFASPVLDRFIVGKTENNLIEVL